MAEARRVEFEYKKETGTNLVWYPDDKAYFSRSIVYDGIHHADYTGDLPLDDSTEGTYVMNVECITAVGGDTPMVIRDGVDTAQFRFTLKLGFDDDAPVVEQTKKVLIAFKDRLNNFSRVIRVQLTDGVGVCTVTFPETDPATVLDLSIELTETKAPTLQFAMVGITTLVVYDDYTGV